MTVRRLAHVFAGMLTLLAAATGAPQESATAEDVVAALEKAATRKDIYRGHAMVDSVRNALYGARTSGGEQDAAFTRTVTRAFFALSEDDPMGAFVAPEEAWAALRQLRFDDARAALTRGDELLAALDRIEDSGEIPEALAWWIERADEPRFLNAEMRCLYFQSLGLVDQSQAALEELQRIYRKGGEGRIGWLHTLRMTEVEQRLVAAEYASAARHAARHTDEFDEERRFRLDRRRVIARAKLALLDGELRGPVRSELEALSTSPYATAGDLLDATFRQVGLALLDGDADAAQAAAASVHDLDGSPLERALALALRIEAGEAATLDGPQGGTLDEMLDGALEELHSAWLATPPRRSGTGRFFSDKVRYVVRVAAQRDLANRDARAAMDRLLKWQSLHDLARLLDEPRITCAQLEASLGTDESLVAFWSGDREGIAFVLHGGEVHALAIPGVELLRAPLTGLRRALVPQAAALPGWREDWNEASARLSEALWVEGIGPAIGDSRRLALVGTDQMLGLPLRALLVDGEPLGLRYAMRQLPLASLAVTRPAPDLVGGEVRLVTGVPKKDWTDPRSGTLEHVMLDAAVRRDAGRALEPGYLELLGAGVDAIRGGALDGSGLAIFYCHGDDSGDPERPSALLLGGTGDGRLSCVDVESVASPPAVFLATCRAAEAPERIGSAAANHLGGAFLRGGAATVVLSSVDLGIDSTGELLRTLIEHLAAGETFGESLRLTRRDLFGRPGFEHPSSVLALSVLGDDDFRVREPAARGGLDVRIVLAIGALAALVAFALIRRRAAA